MSILQISKIQHRSGNLVDLPQLDEAEFGWASDQKRLFIGKTVPNENIEVLTSYSKINFSQINGAVGNLNISPLSVENGQVLAYDGTNWINRGGFAGGLITLGDVSNVKLTGGAIGYVLETDGTGNLSWAPKSTIVAYVENVTLGDGTPGNYTIVTTTSDSAFGQGAAVTITGVVGTTELNGATYYVALQSANSFALYTDANLTTPLNSSTYGEFPYSTVSETSTVNDRITVADATNFTIGDTVVFDGNLGNSTLNVGRFYYVTSKDTSAPNTWIVVSETVGGTSVDPGTATGLDAIVYAYGGRLVSSVSSGGSGGGFPGGTNTSIQFNRTSTFAGSADFTYNDTSKQFTVNGNANVGNLNASGVINSGRFISTITTGTTPLEVVSTTRVANLNVEYANVADYAVVTEATTGTYYPILASSNSSANYTLLANANLSFDALTGNLSTNLLRVVSNATVGNLGTSGVINASGNITGANLITGGTLNVTGNANVGNLGSAGSITAIGNIAAGNLSTSGILSVPGNATLGNLSATTATISTGNIGNINSGLLQNGTSNVAIVSGGNVTLGVAGSTRVTATSSGANVTGTLGVSGNISSGNLTTGGVLSVTGNANVGNLSTNGVVSATGNITGGNLIAVNSVVATGNVSGGNLTTGGNLFVDGNITAGNTSTERLTVTGNVSLTGSNVSLGAVGNVKITGGTSGFVVITDGAGNLSFANPVTVGTQPAGLDTQVQYNNSGALGASAGLTFNETSNVLTVSNNVTASRLISTIATGTAPLTVISSTQVANLRSQFAGTANVANSVNWSNVVDRPTNVSQFNNDAGYITSAFPSGTRMMFAQTNAPTGWTKDTSAIVNNSALRVVTGTAGTGGTVNFSAAFTSQAVTGTLNSAVAGGSIGSTTAGGSVDATTATGTIGSTSTTGSVNTAIAGGTVGSTTLTVDQIPSHRHFVATNTVDGGAPSSTNSLVRQRTTAGDSDYYLEGTSGEPSLLRSSATGGGGSHTHSFTGNGHTHNFTGSTHTHSFTGTSHSHTFTGTSHGHTFTGTSHSHTFSGNNIDLAVKYVDVIVATKD